MEPNIQDFLGWSNDKEILKIIKGEKLYYSNKLYKYNSFSMKQERNLLLTDKSLYNFKNKKLKRQMKYEEMLGITFSKQNNELVIHGKDGYDFHFGGRICPNRQSHGRGGRGSKFDIIRRAWQYVGGGTIFSGVCNFGFRGNVCRHNCRLDTRSRRTSHANANIPCANECGGRQRSNVWRQFIRYFRHNYRRYPHARLQNER